MSTVVTVRTRRSNVPPRAFVGPDGPARAVVTGLATAYLLLTVPGARGFARNSLYLPHAADRGLLMAVLGAAAGLAGRFAARGGPDRWPCALLAGALATTGLTCAVVAVESVPTVVLAVGWAALPVWLIVGLPELLRSGHRGTTRIDRTGVGVIALAGSTAAAGVVGQGWPDAGAAAPIAGLALDLVALGAIAALIVTRDRRPPARWWLILAGAGSLAVSDVVQQRSPAGGATEAAGLAVGLWALSAALFALAASCPDGARPTATGRRGPDRSDQPDRRHRSRPSHRADAGRRARPARRPGTVRRLAGGPATVGGLALSVLVGAAVRGGLPPQVVALACAGIILSADRIVGSMQWSGAEPVPPPRPDDVTGLADRQAFGEQTDRALAADRTAAVLLIGLDRLRHVNETLGHQTGDNLLGVVAELFETVLGPRDRLARIGGDTFAVLMPGAGADAAHRTASRLRSTLTAPVLLAGLPVQVDANIGIALAPDDGRTSIEVLRRADTAMSAAKRSRSGHRFYGPDCAITSRERLRVRGELRGALRGGQIVLRYQPKCDLASGRVTGVEALVRWSHPHDGLRGPDTFLPEMEDAGLMPALTRHVLRVASADCARWRAAGVTLPVAVNVPASVIVEESLPADVMAILGEVGLPPSALRLEITEDSLLARRDKAAGTMTALRAHGIRISLDDYGTGYCSLSYLRELPVDELKLDRSFVSHLLDEAGTAEIVRSTVQLAHALNLRMVAEGVENARTWAALSAWGCDEGQGYFMARPMPGDEVLPFLAEWAGRTRPPVRRPAVTFVVATAGSTGPATITPITVHHRARPNLWSAGSHASSARCSSTPARTRSIRT